MSVGNITDTGAPTLLGGVNSREPKAEGKDGKSVATTAINDALIVVIVAWALLVILPFSLRSSNV
jgi:hypothetical protein